MPPHLSRRSGLTAATAMLGLLPLLAACGSAAPPEPGATTGTTTGDGAAPLTIVASTTVWGSVASAVAGPGATVDSIIDDVNADPHSYEATPADAAALASADLVVLNGGHYDEFVEQALGTDPEAQARSVNAFTLHEGGAAPAAPQADHSHDDHDHGAEGHDHGAEGHDHGGVNEHIWFEPATVTAVAREIGTRLGQAEPARAAEFTQRAEQFAGRVDEIAAQYAGIGQARPGARAVATEPVSQYLQQAAGITDVTPPPYAQAVLAENDPPALGVAQTTQLLGARGADMLFYNPQTSTTVTQQLRAAAEQAGVPVVEVAESVPAGTDYLAWFAGYRADIATALGLPQ